MEKAAAQTNKAKETFDKLGISVTDSSGKMKTQEQVFEEAVQALQKMEDGTEKARIAQDLFGRSGQELMPLLNGSAASVEELKRKAHDLGMVMSDETVDAGVKMTDTIDTLKRSGQGMLNQIGGAILPIVQKLFDAIIKHMPQIQSAIQQVTPIITMLLSQLLPPLMDLASQILPPIAQIIMSILPPLSQIISSILPVITQLLQMLLPPIIKICQMVLPLLLSLIKPLLPLLQPLLGLLQPFIDLLLQLITPLIDLINIILPPIIKIFTTLIKSILPPLKAAFSGVAKVVSGVFKTAFNAIKPIIDNIKKILNGIIKFITGVFKGDWKEAWNGIVDLFKGIVNHIPSFFETVINGAIGLINGIIGGINGVTGAVGIPEIPKIPEVKLPRLRIGMEYVPYDDFPALLHKGEQVLTASEAKEYRKNKGASGIKETSVVNNFTFKIEKFVAKNKQDIDELLGYAETELGNRAKKKGSVWVNA